MSRRPTVQYGHRPPQLDQPSTQELPCVTCRTRKVRCSKTEPCSNCERAGIECRYDSTRRIANRGQPQSTDLAHRVTQLEELVRYLSQRLGERNDTPEVPAVRRLQGTIPAILPTGVLDETILNRQQALGAVNSEPTRHGKLIYEKEKSRHLHCSFWASMYDEVGNVACIGSLLR